MGLNVDCFKGLDLIDKAIFVVLFFTDVFAWRLDSGKVSLLWIILIAIHFPISQVLLIIPILEFF